MISKIYKNILVEKMSGLLIRNMLLKTGALNEVYRILYSIDKIVTVIIDSIVQPVPN